MSRAVNVHPLARSTPYRDVIGNGYRVVLRFKRCDEHGRAVSDKTYDVTNWTDRLCIGFAEAALNARTYLSYTVDVEEVYSD